MNQTFLESSLFIEGFATFAGAFFAYLFLRISDFFSKIYQRQVKHFNSLIRLETQLNETTALLYDNTYLIPKFQSALDQGKIYFNKLYLSPIDKSHLTDLHDIELINEVFTYHYDQRKLSDDITTLSSGYKILIEAYTQKNITTLEYTANCQHISKQLQQVHTFIANQIDTTISLQALIRIHAKTDVPFGTKIMRIFIKTASDSKAISDKDVVEEEKKLKAEIEASRSNSKEEIEKLMRKHKRR